MWPVVYRLRDLGCPLGSRSRPGQRAHAGDRWLYPGGGTGLSLAPIHNHCRRRCRRFRADVDSARRACRHRLPDRRHSVRCGGLHWHARLCPCQCAHSAGRSRQPCRRPRRRLQVGRHHRHAGGRPRALGRFRLLRLSHGHHGSFARQPRRYRCAGRARFRRLAHLHLRPSGRRYLHQGC